jgi:hypothetical protein
MGITLIAKEGYIYTDGADTFGFQIHLAEGVDKSAFYEIPIAEYELILAEKAEQEEEYID